MIKFLSALFLSSYSFYSVALLAEEVTRKIEYKRLYTGTGVDVKEYHPDMVQGIANWLLEAMGVYVEAPSKSYNGRNVRVFFTSLRESSSGSVQAEYAPVIIDPGKRNCHMTQAVLQAMIKEMPIRNYQEYGRCRPSAGTNIKSNFFARFEILKRLDKAFQHDLIHTRQFTGTSHGAKGQVLYLDDSGKWIKYKRLPSPYGSEETPVLANSYEIQRYSRPCEWKYSFTEDTWVQCKDDAQVTIHELPAAKTAN